VLLKKVIPAAFAVAMIYFSGMVPGYILSSAEVYQIITPEVSSYRFYVKCKGNAKAIPQYSITAGDRLTVEEILIDNGAWVNKGEPIARLSKAIDAPYYITPADENNTVTQNTADMSAIASSLGIDESTLLSYMSAHSQMQESSLSVSSQEDNTVFELLAPISGTVANAMGEVGTTVNSGSLLCSVSGEIGVEVMVSEYDISDIHLGGKAIVSFEGGEINGFVSSIGTSAQKTLGSSLSYENSVPVEITLETSSPNLKAGFSVTAQIFTSDETEIYKLPYEAIRQDENESAEYVLKLSEEGIVRCDITVGKEFGDGAQILSGAIPGENIIIADREEPVSELFILRR